MEIENDNAAMLSNMEVLKLLQEFQCEKRKRKEKSKGLQNISTVSYETIKYLEGTPCKNQQESQINAFMNFVEPFNLTKAEKLQLINQKPTTLVELQLIIEESEERLNEEEMEKLLEVISDSFLGDENEAEESV